MLVQTEHAIDAFESRTKARATALFVFDNAPSHQKRPADGLSARHIPKKPHATWTDPNSKGVKMRNGTLPDGSSQAIIGELAAAWSPWSCMDMHGHDNQSWPCGSMWLHVAP
jgi:hypothetical protein